MYIAFSRIGLFAVLSIFISACGDHDNNSALTVPDNTGPSLQVASQPDILRNVNPVNLELELSIGGKVVENITKGMDKAAISGGAGFIPPVLIQRG